MSEIIPHYKGLEPCRLCFIALLRGDRLAGRLGKVLQEDNFVLYNF